MYIYYLFHCYLGRFGTIKPVYPPPLVIQYLARSVSGHDFAPFYGFAFGFQSCSVDSVAVFVFFYQILELFRQCGSFCFFIRFQNCSDSVVVLFFSIRFQNCSDSVVVFVFLLDFRTVPTVWQFLFFLLDFRTVPTVWQFFF